MNKAVKKISKQHPRSESTGNILVDKHKWQIKDDENQCDTEKGRAPIMPDGLLWWAS